MLCALLGALTLHAQSARWEPAGGKLTPGVISDIMLVVENCEPAGDPAPPKVPGLMLALRGSAQSISIVNFTKTVSRQYSFAARLEKKEAAEIPAFTLATDKGPLTVAAARFEPGDATVGNTKLSVEDISQSKFQFASDSVWAGEVFALTYRIDVLRRYYYQVASNPDWDPSPLVTEEWAKPEVAEARNKGDAVLSIQYRTRAYAREAGSFQFNAAQQLMNIRTANSGGFGFFGAQPDVQQLAVSSDQPRITVKPLPSPAPASFAGAVGQFKLLSRIVPAEVHAGEPVTWTLELSGTGNWPAVTALPQRSIPKSFEVVKPQARRVLTEGKLFEGSLTEDLVMIPRTPGNFTIPAMVLSYFDPKDGKYKTLSSEKVTIVVTAATATTPATTGTNGTGQGGSHAGQPQTAGLATPHAEPKTPGTIPAVPSAPAPIPGDPLSVDALAVEPLSEDNTRTLALLAPACIPVLWLLLASLRALARDPAAPRRRALSRLRKRLSGALPSGTPALTPFLKAWQKDTAAALGMNPAAPSLLPLCRALNPREAALLGTLWNEAEALLYGQAKALPSDWLSRAHSLVAGLSAPGFKPVTILRHLIPALVFAALLLNTPVAKAASAADNARETTSNQARALAAYSNSNYTEAVRLWSAEVALRPLDWGARHNLGIAQLQGGQPGAAMAQLGAAFLQNPTDERLRRDFRIACTQAGASPEVLGALSGEGPVPELSRLAPVRCWQLSLAVASLLVSLGLGVLLARAYGHRFPLQRTTAFTLLGAGLAGLLLAGVVLHHFGPAAESKAALVWQNTSLRSIPTEADAMQKTAALPTGTLVRVDKEFPGWRHVTLTNGDGGWIRTTDIVMLWK